VNKTFYSKTLTSISLRTAAYFERLKLTEHTFMIIVAIIIGVLAGFAAIGIRLLIREISNLSFSGDGTLLENIMSTPWYWVLIIHSNNRWFNCRTYNLFLRSGSKRTRRSRSYAGNSA